MKPILINESIALALILIFALIRYFFHRDIFEQIKKFRSLQVTLRQIKDDLHMLSQSAIALNLLSYFALSLLVNLLYDTYAQVKFLESPFVFLLALLIVPAVIVSKRILLMVIAKVFRIQHFMKIYLYEMSLSRKISGLLLLPLASLYFGIHHIHVFRQIVLYCIILAVVLIFIFTIFKTLNSLVKNSAFHFNLHFFVYLCALEILPVAIFYQKFIG